MSTELGDYPPNWLQEAPETTLEAFQEWLASPYTPPLGSQVQGYCGAPWNDSDRSQGKAAPARASIASRADPASPKLVDCTLTKPQQSQYFVTMKEFGDGIVTIQGVYQDELWRGGGGKSKDTQETDRKPSLERADSTVRRGRRTVRERCWMLKADRMITLNKRGKFSDPDELWARWQEFVRLCRSFWRTPLEFVAALERHKTGGWHLHVAIRGYRDIGMLRRLWYRALGGTGRESGEDTPGAINIRGTRGGASTSHTKIASYLSKYLGKQFAEALRNRKAFSSSRGIPQPKVTTWNQPVELGRDGIASAMRRARSDVAPENRDRSGRLVGLAWFAFEFGGVHGWRVQPL